MSSLADVHEPLVLADGTKIDPLTGKMLRVPAAASTPPGFVAVPSASEAIKQVTRVRRALSDLPAPPKSMNAISVVCMYTMLGLSDEDISIATGMTQEQVGRIKMLEAYTTVHAELINNILSADSENVRDLLAANARAAAAKVTSLLDSESEGMQLAAAKDILDRAGHRPVDVVDHRLSMQGGLRIEIVKRDNVDATVVIEGVE